MTMSIAIRFRNLSIKLQIFLLLYQNLFVSFTICMGDGNDVLFNLRVRLIRNFDYPYNPIFSASQLDLLIPAFLNRQWENLISRLLYVCSYTIRKFYKNFKLKKKYLILNFMEPNLRSFFLNCKTKMIKMTHSIILRIYSFC